MTRGWTHDEAETLRVEPYNCASGTGTTVTYFYNGSRMSARFPFRDMEICDALILIDELRKKTPTGGAQPPMGAM